MPTPPTLTEDEALALAWDALAEIQRRHPASCYAVIAGTCVGLVMLGMESRVVFRRKAGAVQMERWSSGGECVVHGLPPQMQEWAGSLIDREPPRRRRRGARR